MLAFHTLTPGFLHWAALVKGSIYIKQLRETSFWPRPGSLLFSACSQHTVQRKSTKGCREERKELPENLEKTGQVFHCHSPPQLPQKPITGTPFISMETKYQYPQSFCKSLRDPQFPSRCYVKTQYKLASDTKITVQASFLSPEFLKEMRSWEKLAICVTKDFWIPL